MGKLNSTGRASNMVAIVGGGMAGIAMGVQLKRLLDHENFHIFEKGDSIGGTWAHNRYPNLSCDVPSEFYSFSFFQNPDWSEKYASQPEILRYIEECTRHFELEPHISLQHECRSMNWDEEQQLWTLWFYDFECSESYAVQARYVVAATGVLNVPNGMGGPLPLARFRGHMFHTSQWRDVDFENKRVMVIGNGCSANQVIPWILDQSPQALIQLARSAQWMAPKRNHPVSNFTKWILRHVPLAVTIRRLWSAFKLDSSFFVFRRSAIGTMARKSAAGSVMSYMSSILNPAYHDILLPRYDLGAKRPVMDHGYLGATNNPGFMVVRCDGIASVIGENMRTVVDCAGNTHEVDIIILANGFKTQDFLSSIEIQGLIDSTLHELWHQRGGPEAYMGVSVHGFPNLFMLAGPNTLPSGNSTLHGIECSVIYITRLLHGLRKGKSAQRIAEVTLMARPDSEARHNEWIQNRISMLIYTSRVSTWYINKDTGKNTLIWPGTQLSFWWSRCVSPVRWSDWYIKNTGGDETYKGVMA